MPDLSPWLCTPGWPEGRMRRVTGLNWPGSSWFLLILAPAAVFSLACVQADCQAAFHSITQVGEGRNLRDFSRLSASAGTGTSPCTRASTSMRHTVLCVTTGSPERVTCPRPSCSTELQTWHMIFKAINFTSSQGCAAPQSLQQAAKLSRSFASAQKNMAVWKQLLRLILLCG